MWSIGHSTHTIERFVTRLDAAGVRAVADVRSRPFSRFVPVYNRDALEAALRERGIVYHYMGEALGGRTGEQKMPGYHQRVQQPVFLEGINKLLELSTKQPLAMMCAERHPLDCHRFRLIGRYLLTQGCDVRHLLAEGGEVRHSEIEAQWLSQLEADLFSDDGERLDRAYKRAR